MDKINIALKDYKRILNFPPLGLKLSESTEYLNSFEYADEFKLTEVGKIKTKEGEGTILTLEFTNEKTQT